MIEIWGRKNSSNVIPVMWTLAELKIPYKRHNVGGSFGGTNTDSYARMNPNKLVPTMNDQGFILWESNAIVRYLCRQYAYGSLCPDDPREAAQADQWMEWYKSSVMTKIHPVFWGLIRVPLEQRDLTKTTQGATEIAKVLGVLDNHLDQRTHVLGDTFTMADIPLGASMYRYYNLDIEHGSFPNIESWYDRLCQRPAYQDHAMIPFGNSLDDWIRLEKTTIDSNND